VSSNTAIALQHIHMERCKQKQKWGRQTHEPIYWLGIIGEEYGEVCKNVIEGKDPRDELLHLAATVAAMYEYIHFGEA
jgi:hypothetical protein